MHTRRDGRPGLFVAPDGAQLTNLPASRADTYFGAMRLEAVPQYDATRSAR